MNGITTSVTDYIIQIKKERAERNVFMLSDDSPLIKDQKLKFEGLDYIKIDPAFVIVAKIVRTQNETVNVTMTDNSTVRLKKYGTVEFNFYGDDYQLDVLVGDTLQEIKDDKAKLFIPFKAKTPNSELFDGGRYITVEDTLPNDQMIVDFNRAYNPYNGYHRARVSFTPPAKNVTPIGQPVGQRKFEDRI